VRLLCFALVATSVLLTVWHDAGAQSLWSIDTVPLVRIAGSTADGNLVFSDVAGATRLSSGAIVVAEKTGGKVRFFDVAGRSTGSVGRTGTGPGEFRYVSWVGQCAADSVFVWDFAQTRVTVIGPTGEVARQYRIPPTPSAGPVPSMMSCSSTGVFAAIGRPHELAPPSGTQFGSRVGQLVIMDAKGTVSRAVGDVRSFEYAIESNGNVIARPLGKVTSLALSRRRLYVGTADSGFVDVYTLDGRRTGAIPLRPTARRPTSTQYERAVDELLAYLPQGSMRESGKQRILRLPMPEHLPPYTALLVDPDDVLWAVLSTAGDLETRLRAIHADGRLLADVRIPIGMKVFEVGRDYILGSHEDRDGEPWILIYRLRRDS
jgi:hypothetical protein